MRKVKQYDEKAKRQAIQYVRETGKSITQVERELGIPASTLRGWLSKHGQEPEVADVQNVHSEGNSTQELQRRISDLEEENIRLKKAMYIFVKDYR